MAELALDDVLRNAGHRLGDVLKQPLSRVRRHQAEEVADLAVVVVAVAVIEARRLSARGV